MTVIPYRRVVPAGYSTGILTMVGTAPLLMNSGETDRESDQFRAFKSLGAKRGKTLDDEKRIRELEWGLALYLDKDLGPYIPSKNLHSLLREAATKWKEGANVKRSLIVIETRIPLTYEGPRDQAGLWEAGFRYEAMVSNAGPSKSKVVRCRPCFDGWSLGAAIAWDPEDIDEDRLHQIIERSQKYGLGDYKPTFGTFTANLDQVEILNEPVKANAAKDRDKLYEKAHQKARERVMVGGK